MIFFGRKVISVRGVSSLSECRWSRKPESLLDSSDERLPQACLRLFLSLPTPQRLTFTAGCPQFLRFGFLSLLPKRLNGDGEWNQTGQEDEVWIGSAHLMNPSTWLVVQQNHDRSLLRYQSGVRHRPSVAMGEFDRSNKFTVHFWTAADQELILSVQLLHQRRWAGLAVNLV